MTVLIKQLGIQDYPSIYAQMQSFTDHRTDQTADEIWVVQHPPVFTQGLNGKAEHLLARPEHIPLVQSDRGGQITYHGPGQLIVYCLLDLKRAKLGVKDLVHRIEKAIIKTLAQISIESYARADAPGVYVNGQKIASLGLKVRKHKTYHGLSLNIDMDLSPFNAINPCGLSDIKMCQTSQFSNQTFDALTEILLSSLKTQLSPQISF